MTANVPGTAVIGPGPRTGGGRPPLARLLVVLAVMAAATAGLFTGTASAHAALLGTTPGDGSVVATAPKAVTLHFSEQVSLPKNAIRVLDPSDKRVDRGVYKDVSSRSEALYSVALRGGLANGTYTVAWSAISADTHPVAGAFTFSIGAPSRTTAKAVAPHTGGGLVGVLYGIARYLSYAGFAVLVGACAFVLLCRPRGAALRPVQRLVVRAWITFTAATLALLLLRAPYTGSGGLFEAVDLGALQGVLATEEGAALVSRLLLLGAAALCVAVLFGSHARLDAARDGLLDGRTGDDPEAAAAEAKRRDLVWGLGIGGTLVAAGLAATWSLTEHASTGVQTAVAMPVDIVHLLAVAVWLGGLAALLAALYATPAVEAATVRRFSRTAFVCVLVLVASGLYQSWRQLGSWSALGGTTYGRYLLVKVGLVAVVVVIASFSRRWTGRLVARAAAGTTGGEAEDAVAAAASRPAAPQPTVGVRGTSTPARGGGDARRDRAHEEEAPLKELEPATAAATAGGASASPTAVADPERAAQLARQRAAIDSARDKRARDADPLRSGLRRSVLAEAGVAVLVLVAATLLSNTESGRTAEAAAHAPGTSVEASLPAGPVDVTVPFDTGGPHGKGVAEFYMDPARTGADNLVHLYLNGPDDRPLPAPEVDASLTLRAQRIGPLPITLQHIAAGHWAAEHLRIPEAGTWQLALTVRTSAIDEVTVFKNVRIG